jgi:hypothetical protein
MLKLNISGLSAKYSALNAFGKCLRKKKWEENPCIGARNEKKKKQRGNYREKENKLVQKLSKQTRNIIQEYSVSSPHPSYGNLLNN